MTRSDDVINVAGHRLSTGAMEEIIAEHHDIAEVAVVGIQDELKGQIPLALYVKLSNVTTSDEIIMNDLIKMVREKIGAIACFKHGLSVKRLPKTRSGKTLRRTIRSIANEEKDIKIPATIEDVTVVDEIKNVLIEYITKHK